MCHFTTGLTHYHKTAVFWHLLVNNNNNNKVNTVARRGKQAFITVGLVA